MVPASCAEHIFRTKRGVAAGNTLDSALDESHVVGLCAGASSVAPALCYYQAPSGLSKDHQTMLCEGATRVYTDGSGSRPVEKSAAAVCARSGLEHNLDGGVVVHLCRSHVVVEGDDVGPTNGPIDCAIETPYGFSPQDVLALCSGASSSSPSACAKQVGGRFSNSQKASVCAGASDDVPARCIEHLPSTLSQDDAVRLCGDAKSLTPAYCARQKGRVSEADIEQCKKEVSEPSR